MVQFYTVSVRTFVIPFYFGSGSKSRSGMIIPGPDPDPPKPKTPDPTRRPGSTTLIHDLACCTWSLKSWAWASRCGCRAGDRGRAAAAGTGGTLIKRNLYQRSFSTVRYQYGQCCGSASPWCGSEFDLAAWYRSEFDLAPWCGFGSTFRLDEELGPDQDPSFKKGSNPWKSAKIGSHHMPGILAWHLQIDADPDPVPDPAYKFLCGSGCGSGFYWCGCGSGCRSRLPKWCGSLRIRIHNTEYGSTTYSAAKTDTCVVITITSRPKFCGNFFLFRRHSSVSVDRALTSSLNQPQPRTTHFVHYRYWTEMSSNLTWGILVFCIDWNESLHDGLKHCMKTSIVRNSAVNQMNRVPYTSTVI